MSSFNHFDESGAAIMVDVSGKSPTHPLAIHHAAIDFMTDAAAGTITVTATVRALERTGVEMEAMVAASVAALTIYDMCKGADKGIRIGDVALLFKEGGKSGTWRREGTE